MKNFLNFLFWFMFCFVIGMNIAQQNKIDNLVAQLNDHANCTQWCEQQWAEYGC